MQNMNRLLSVLLLASVLSVTEAFGQIRDRVIKPRPKPPTTTTTTTTKPKPPKKPTKTKRDSDQTIRVSTAEEFLRAIDSNRTIIIAKGKTLNLSAILADSQKYKAVGLTSWPNDEGNKQSSAGVFGEGGLYLNDIYDMTIIGEDNVTIEIDSRTDHVIHMSNCKNIVFKGLSLGHSYQGELNFCGDGACVIDCFSCQNITIENCDLYGCGYHGLYLTNSNDVTCNNTIIHDCTSAAIYLYESNGINMNSCDIIRCGEVDGPCYFEKSNFVEFNRCRFSQNQGYLFENNSSKEFVIRNCEIHHTSEKGDVGTINDIGSQWYYDNPSLHK